ncbi:methylated-DNA--[protein]-cysteine S-methyltransferase [Sphingomonas sp. KR1UV-12]|uniref:Methylated-DNA--protein-cysteine methyltransferase n=1 Tax=Sphingomonas aurea TaxID=3063994 RepID=A0ABT9EM32_9SPHN|nr:methylated-DNA--[protein]-cysteine S-methyltransferase [Sphingomonas sp. KR1UV-12]MDP1028009.1 methylated-DNA--[protein]-cysteine S-methyltransferase [Sphingomonas sp. KR1UV-12]
MSFAVMASPVGALTLVATAAGLAAVLWECDDGARVRLDHGGHDPDHPVLSAATAQLAQYFAGQRRTFDLPLAPAGTPFQQQVWAALRTIPWGETRSYAAIATAIGRPTAIRAVGAANGRNPLSIVVPCHRVIGSNGALTGFAGGLAAKDLLLGIEGRQRALV